MRIFCVILAKRSERIPEKNFQKIHGRSLIDRCVDTAKSILPFEDRVYISSSFGEYVRKAEERKCYFITRPENLSDSGTFISDVIRQAAIELKNGPHHAQDDDIIVNLDICCPFTRTQDVNEIINYMVMNDLDSCFTAKLINHSLVDSKPSCSQNRSGAVFHWPAVRARKVKTAINAHGWGKGRKHADIPCIPDWHIDINLPKDLINARLMWPIRNRLIP